MSSRGFLMFFICFFFCIAFFASLKRESVCGCGCGECSWFALSFCLSFAMYLAN